MVQGALPSRTINVFPLDAQVAKSQVQQFYIATKARNSEIAERPQH